MFATFFTASVSVSGIFFPHSNGEEVHGKLWKHFNE
jgi:hypothetical protein